MRRPAPLLVALLAATAVAAQPAPETVDADVFYGLLGIEDPSVLVTDGQPGPELQSLLPPGATVLAMLSRSPAPGGGERYGTVLAHVTAPPREAAEAYTLPEGWSQPTQHEPEPYGFVSNESEIREQTRFVLCPDDGGQDARLEFSGRPGGGAHVRVSLSPIRPSWCTPRTESPRPTGIQGRHREMETKLPPLTAPEGTRLRQTGGGGGADDVEEVAELEGDLSLAEVAGHFGTEMEQAGWTQRGASVEPDLAVSTWTRGSDDGPLVLMLTARPDGPGAYSLRLEMLAPPRE